MGGMVMSKSVSVGAMIHQLEGLVDTKDVSAWENEFIENMVLRTQTGKHTTMLTERQVEIVERIWSKHFA